MEKEPIRSHDLARKLLEAPNTLIVIPKNKVPKNLQDSAFVVSFGIGGCMHDEYIVLYQD